MICCEKAPFTNPPNPPNFSALPHAALSAFASLFLHDSCAGLLFLRRKKRGLSPNACICCPLLRPHMFCRRSALLRLSLALSSAEKVIDDTAPLSHIIFERRWVVVRRKERWMDGQFSLRFFESTCPPLPPTSFFPPSPPYLSPPSFNERLTQS